MIAAFLHIHRVSLPLYKKEEKAMGKKYYKSNRFRRAYLPLFSEMLARDIPAVFISLQTTGLMPYGDNPDEIIQFSAAKAHADRSGEFKETDSFSFLFKPSKSIPKDASVRNGLTDSMFADAPLIEDKWQDIRKFFGEPVVVFAHNVKFAMTFLDALALDKGLIINVFAWVGTDELARDTVRPGLVKSYSYRNLFSFFNIPVKVGDGLGTAEGLLRMSNSLVDRFRSNPPKCGTFVPEIMSVEFVDEEDSIKVSTEYGDLYYMCANGFWADCEDGLLIGFFDMEKFQETVFARASATDGMDFCRQMKRLLTA